MKVLLVAGSYDAEGGPVARHVRALAAGLTGRGHRVVVAVPSGGGTASTDDEDDVTVHRIPSGRRRDAVLPFVDRVLRRGLRDVVLAERPDVIHAHDWTSRSLPGRDVVGATPVLRTLHDDGDVCLQCALDVGGAPCPGPSPLRCASCSGHGLGVVRGAEAVLRGMTSLTRERALLDAVFADSAAVAEANRLATSHLPYEVVPPFVPDRPVVAHGDPALAALPASPFVLFVGDVTRGRGIHVLAAAHGLLRTRHDVALVCIGRAGAWSPALPADTVMIDGWPIELVRAAMERAVATVVPAVTAEPSPSLAVEALAMGCPVVASRVGGLAEVVDHGRSGLLVTPGDEGALAGAIASLLDDPARRAALSAGARRRAEAFRASVVVPLIEARYLRAQGVTGIAPAAPSASPTGLRRRPVG